MQIEFIYFVIALFAVITIHEFSHAWVANALGDPTARIMGRMTLNPFAHLDLIGTLMLFIVGIGWGKPVQVNPRNFKKPMQYSAYVSLAGPMSNFLTAFVLALPLKYLNVYMPVIVENLLWAVFDLSVLLGTFNILPLPPLDGSKFFGLFIPKAWERGYEHYLRHGVKYFIIFILIDAFILRQIWGVSVLSLTVITLFNVVRSVILLGT